MLPRGMSAFATGTPTRARLGDAVVWLMWAFVGWCALSALATPFIGLLLGGARDLDKGATEVPVAIARTQQHFARRRRHAMRRAPSDNRLRANVG